MRDFSETRKCCSVVQKPAPRKRRNPRSDGFPSFEVEDGTRQPVAPSQLSHYGSGGPSRSQANPPSQPYPPPPSTLIIVVETLIESHVLRLILEMSVVEFAGGRARTDQCPGGDNDEPEQRENGQCLKQASGAKSGNGELQKREHDSATIQKGHKRDHTP